MSKLCEAGFELPARGPCPECGASESDPCLKAHGGKPGKPHIYPEALEDLYEALEYAEKSIAAFMRTHSYPMESGAGDILLQVRTALAKARGEQ